MILFNLLVGFGKFSYKESIDELTLMKQIKARDTQALEALYDLYKSLLYSMIISIVKTREEAEDVLQEVFMQIWEKAYTFDENRGNLYGWIVTLTRNKAIDRIRSKGYKTRKKVSADVNDPALSFEGNYNDPLETTIFSDRAELVKKALSEIPEEQSKIIKIAYYQGLSQTEISDHLDIPLGTVKTRTRLGMMKLKNILEEYISKNV